MLQFAQTKLSCFFIFIGITGSYSSSFYITLQLLISLESESNTGTMCWQKFMPELSLGYESLPTYMFSCLGSHSCPEIYQIYMASE